MIAFNNRIWTSNFFMILSYQSSMIEHIHANTSLIEGGILSIWLFAQNRYTISVFVFQYFRFYLLIPILRQQYLYSILFVRSWERYHVFLWIFHVKYLLLFHVAAFSCVCINVRYILRFLAPCHIYNVRHQLNFHLDKISKRKYIYFEHV